MKEYMYLYKRECSNRREVAVIFCTSITSFKYRIESENRSSILQRRNEKIREFSQQLIFSRYFFLFHIPLTLFFRFDFKS